MKWQICRSIFEIVEFISELEIYNDLKGKGFEDVTALMLRFSGKADFLHNGRKFLQERISEKEMNVFERCMQSKGRSFTN